MNINEQREKVCCYTGLIKFDVCWIFSYILTSNNILYEVTLEVIFSINQFLSNLEVRTY